MNLVVKLRVEQYPEADGDGRKLLDLIKHLVTLADAVNLSLAFAEQDAVCTAVVVDEEDEVAEEIARYVDKVPASGGPYRIKPEDGRRYVQGPGGWYPVPTHAELDAAEAEFREVGGAPPSPLSLVKKEEKSDGEQ